MLFVSERSWKHHYVTLLLPYTYLMYRVLHGPPRREGVRVLLGTAMALSAFLMATTSSELGGLFADGQGHKIAQAYGMFLWAGVVLYCATAWRVWVERADASVDKSDYEGLRVSTAPSRDSTRRSCGPHPDPVSESLFVKFRFPRADGARPHGSRSNALTGFRSEPWHAFRTLL